MARMLNAVRTIFGPPGSCKWEVLATQCTHRVTVGLWSVLFFGLWAFIVVEHLFHQHVLYNLKMQIVLLLLVRQHFTCFGNT